MNNKEGICNFLISKSYTQIDKNTSSYFGDYSNVFSNNTIKIRISSSQSFISLDICITDKKENWYDLALVKAFLHHEKILNKETTIQEYFEFLKNDFCAIEELFNMKNYVNTKKNLEELGNIRAKQMFPEI